MSNNASTQIYNWAGSFKKKRQMMPYQVRARIEWGSHHPKKHGHSAQSNGIMHIDCSRHNDGDCKSQLLGSEVMPPNK